MHEVEVEYDDVCGLAECFGSVAYWGDFEYLENRKGDELQENSDKSCMNIIIQLDL